MEENKEVRDVFLAALALSSAAEQSHYLDQVFQDKPELRQRLERLLREHQHLGSFLEEPALASHRPTIVLTESVTEKAGDQIGRYKLLEQIGEGGCGVVYMAEQQEPIRRRVALKVIKLGMDTKQVIARFEAERQALALMDHPNIAKVLDAGTTETGRPFFVMELVRGVKMTDYCDETCLSTEKRLNLFVQVCHAIQHAHQKGIIHRDIKPSNILVTINDGVPVPKVIDFGIAKAISQQLTDKTVFTAFEQFIGTPAYMSPEQALMTSLDIDTRSDIYALGVLLYELLTGHTPFDQRELVAAGLDEMRRIIREQEPIRPSTRLSTLADPEQTTAAKRRRSELPQLIHELRGDLDWIVMKSLEKDRTRRYETANSLADDVLRYVNSEPVQARPPSRLYFFQKLARRNKLVFAAAGAVGLSLALGITISMWLAVRATNARRDEVAARVRADEAARVAGSQRRRAEEGENRAKTNELTARRRGYAADMNLAQQALAMNDLGRARRLLDGLRPQADELDLRGWEWRYLWQQCQSDAVYGLCQRSNEINSLAVSPDGHWLAIGEQNFGGLSVWDLGTRRQVLKIDSGDSEIVAAFSPAESLLAFSTATNLTSSNPAYGVGLWDMRGNKAVGQRLALSGQCRGLAFSADGQTLLTCSTDDQLTRWDIPSSRRLSTCSAPAWFTDIPPLPLAVTADGKLAAHVTRNGGIAVIDSVNGQIQWTAKPPEHHVMALAFSPDGKVLVSGAGVVESSIRLWDVASGQEIGQPLESHRAFVSTLVFWPDGKILTSASADQTIRLWDLRDLSHVQPIGRPLRGHASEVWRLALLPDGKTLVSGGKDGSVCVWDTTVSRPQSVRITLPVKVKAWSFGPDADSVVTVDDRGQVAKWQGADFQERHPLLELGTNTVGICLSSDARLLAVGLTNGVIRVWDLEQRGVLQEFKVPFRRPLPWGFLPRRHQLAICDAEDSTVLHFWDFPTSKEVQSWPEGLTDHLVGAISPDEQWCLLCGWAGESALLDLTTGRSLSPNLNLRQIARCGFSPDGKTFAAASVEGVVGLWDATDWHEVKALRGFLMGCTAVTFSPDGKRLAVGGDGAQAIKLWDAQSYQELLTLEGQSSVAQFTDAAFSADGNVLGARSYQGDILDLWCAPSWNEIKAAEERARAGTGSPPTKITGANRPETSRW
ncbi:MAG TPA: protein kinase [Candidatus Acidoferrum sp.]|nr:protein kinase [Candidatus Acidoferrum sp.]